MIVKGLNVEKIAEAITRDLPFGIWCANFETQTVTGYNHFCELLDVATNVLSFAELPMLVREDYRNVVMLGVADFDTNSEFDLTIPTNHRWLRVKLTHFDTDSKKAYGYVVECIYEGTKNEDQARFFALFNKQTTLNHRTFDHMQEGNYAEATNKILKDIMNTLSADRISVITYDFKNKKQNCQFEVSDYGIESRLDLVKDMSLSSTPWINREMRRQESLYIYDAAQLSADYRSQLDILYCSQSQTLIIMPLSNCSEVFGYVVIDFVQKKREVSSTELEWIKSLGRFIEFSVRMSETEKTCKDNNDILKTMINFVPFGYLQLRYTYSPSGKPENIIVVRANEQFKNSIEMHELEGKTITQLFGRESEHILKRCNDIASNGDERLVDDFMYVNGHNISADVMMPNYNEFICLTSEGDSIYDMRRKKPVKIEKMEHKELITEIHQLIRTQLNAILGFAELMSVEQDVANKEKYMSIIRENAQSLLDASVLTDAMQAADAQPSSEGENEEKSAQNKRKKILVAEDTESNYMLVLYILRDTYDLVWARDGLEAVEKFEAERPDLVLMDVRMPKQSGVIATTRIREIDLDVPIVALTAFAFEDDRDKMMKAGSTDFVSKPVKSAQLKEIVSRYI